MNARELERLLGGYAAGTLTDSEHSALMRAALDDQQLFDALADEEALRDALADPVFRARLRARLAPDAPPERSLRWMWWLAPALAAGLALFFVVQRPDSSQTMEMASAKLPAPEPAAPGATPAPPPSAAPPAPMQQARKAAPSRSGRADREVSTRANEAAPKELREELPPPAAPPAPPPPPKPIPSAVAESVSLSAPVTVAEKKTVKDERAKVAAEADTPARIAVGGARPAAPPVAAASTAAAPSAVAPNPAAAVELDLQIERAVNGRFESAELGALRQGDRVRFRIRPPEDGNLTFAAGGRTNTTAARRGQTYYLPNAEGLPPGDAPLEVAIALQPAATVEPATLFRSRQQAANAPAGSSVGAMRDAAKEQDALATQKAAVAPRTLRLRLEYRPR